MHPTTFIWKHEREQLF